MTLAYVRLAAVGLVRAPLRTALRLVVVAAAVALLGSMLVFLGHSLSTMTSSAVRSVPLDWQGPVASYGAATRVAADASRVRGVLAASPAATGPFSSTEHAAAAGAVQSAPGAILAIPPGYERKFHTLRLLRGSLRPGSIVLDQQLAATLQAQVGDTIRLRARPGKPAHAFRVSGVAVVTAPDVLFQPLNPLLGPAPAQPPADVAGLPLATFANVVAPDLPPGGSAGGLPGEPAGVQWQVHAQVDPSALSGSPAHALARATGVRNSVERSLPGRIQFVDNLGDSLASAAGDALYAETLFVMLAIPGALVALGLAYLAALGAVERDRRDLALLRARGATRRGIVSLAAVESVLLGVAAGACGFGGAVLAVHLLVPGSLSLGPGQTAAIAAACVALGVAGAFAARLAASARALRGTVADARRGSLRETTPLWRRLYLDVVLLALAGLVYWLTARTGFSAVVNPDSNPTLSLSVYMFLAPAFLWIGAALLLVRAKGRALTWLARRAAGGRATTMRGFLLVSAGRRGGALNRGLLAVGLLLAFGVELALFTATYDQQSRVDAQLTLGADVVVDAPPGAVRARRLEAGLAGLRGVAAVSSLDHAYAYVGPDLQDTFGVDPATIGRATTLRDSYFLGGSASQMLARLRARPDAILVSKETITDYALVVGDLLKLRVLDGRTGHFRVARFHVAGVVQEFPSAPRDSFMVVNRSYLLHVTHDPGPNVVFVRAAGDVVSVGRRVEAVAQPAGAVVRNLRRQGAQTVSSITTVDLSGISRIEEAFVIALAAAGMLLYVGVAVAERRQELATMAALGATSRRIAAFVWSEAALVVAGAAALAALLGWLLAEMLVAMLQHVFDPPPDHLASPWGFLGGLAAAALLATVASGVYARYRIGRLPLGAILRDE